MRNVIDKKHIEGTTPLLVRFFAITSSTLLLGIQVLLPLSPVFGADVTVSGIDDTVTESELVSEMNVEDTTISSISEEFEMSIGEDDSKVISEEISRAADTGAPAITTDLATTSLVEVTSMSDEFETSSSDTSGSEEELSYSDTESTPEDIADIISLATDGVSTNDIVLSTSTESTDVSIDEFAETDPELPSDDIAVEDTSAPQDSVVLETESTAENTLSTTTMSSDVLQPEVHTVITDENKFSFSESECTTVGDGSFYCAKGTKSAEPTNFDRVFAAPDAEGDREIYMEKDGELVQITQNTVDDDAPRYDELSNTIVWHRLIAERYQIISYALDHEIETILTSDRYNNMQPSRYGDLVVWQGWVGNDWEIFMEENGERSMLTDNTSHDIAPTLTGEYIIWQSNEADTWSVKVYNRDTKAIETIDDADALSLENPRLVLVYDAKHDNGDIETRGYDLDSGKVVPLSSTPTPMPDSLPSPDETGGEDKAFVTQQVQVKTKVEDDSDPDISGDSTMNSGERNVSGTTTTDIMIPSFEAATTDDITLPSEHIDTELVIPTFGEISAQPVPDLVITPFSEPMASTIVPVTLVAETQ